MARVHGREVARNERLILCWDDVKNGNSKYSYHSIISIALEDCHRRPCAIYDCKAFDGAPKKKAISIFPSIIDDIVGNGYIITKVIVDKPVSLNLSKTISFCQHVQYNPKDIEIFQKYSSLL